MIHLNEKGYETFLLAKKHGFTPDQKLKPHEIMSKLMLIVTEVAEAAEGLRKQEPVHYMEYKNESEEYGKPCGLANELADIVLRTAELATCMHIDLEDAIKRKAEYNATRPPGHGGKIL